MARPLRIEFSGALYHVTSRGDRREAIFEDDEDHLIFLRTLRQWVGLSGGRCYNARIDSVLEPGKDGLEGKIGGEGYLRESVVAEVAAFERRPAFEYQVLAQ